jgi:hypothetical protein
VTLELSGDSCKHGQIKNVTLDKEAYGLLKLWKSSNRDSFSKVIKHAVPVSCTLDSLVACVDAAGTAPLSANEAMEKAISLRPSVKHDPWS